MYHAMIDIESLATTPDACILTVGGVMFDPYNHGHICNSLYLRMEYQGKAQEHRRIDPDTVNWWMQQDPKAQAEAFHGSRTSVFGVFNRLRQWLTMNEVFTVWAHGSFDIVALESLYRDFGRPIPWKYSKVRDSRTLFSLLPHDPRDADVVHHALDDAKSQALGVQEAFATLGIKP